MFCCGVKDGAIHQVLDEKCTQKFEIGTSLSQLVMLSGKKAFFAGVNSENKPGSIQTILYPNWAKLSETQLHSAGVTRMCITFEHTFLFSASLDGTIAYLQIHDKDPRKKEISILSAQTTSEIMIPRAKRDNLIKYINELRTQIEIHKTSRQRI